MSTTDLEKIAAIIKSTQNIEQPRKYEEIQKLFIGLIGIAVVWLFTQVNNNITSIVGTDHKLETIDEKIRVHSIKLQKPRYTADQGEAKINLRVNPLEAKIDDFGKRQEARGTWIDITEKRITSLEQSFEDIQEDLDEIKDLIQKR